MAEFASWTDDDRFAGLHVPETSFGMWFLDSRTWLQHVLVPAIAELDRLAGSRCPARPVTVDIGCGAGHAFRLLRRRFGPSRLIGIDVDASMLARAAATAARHHLSVELRQ